MPRILIVDDEPLISMMVEDWLVNLGHEVVGPARTLDHGLDLATSAPLDGAILDIRLGAVDSYPVAHALQARGVPFAFATGAGEAAAEDAFENPVVLLKPFDFDAVKGVLRKLLPEAE